MPEGSSIKCNKQKSDKLCIIGSDVVSLFPSLKNIETGRLARHAILESDVDFENFDFHMSLRYIMIVGGDALLSKAKLHRLSPKWLGKREDLITIGGSKSKDPSLWRNSEKTIFKSDKKKIVASVMDILINVVMGSHVYISGEKIFLQSNGGPIGLKSTATLAGLAMKLWDIAWLRLLERE